MSKIYTLPIRNFRLQMHTAITKYNKSQAEQPGSSFFYGPIFITILLTVSLFILGSCNEKVTISTLDDVVEVEQLSKYKALEYVYATQAALAQSPERIASLSDQELQHVLAAPDSVKVEGRSEVWHYVGQECVLDVYWTQKSNNIFVQDYYEFRERLNLFHNVSYKEKKMDDWQCIQSLIQNRRQKVEAEFDELYAVLSLNPHKS